MGETEVEPPGAALGRDETLALQCLEVGVCVDAPEDVGAQRLAHGDERERVADVVAELAEPCVDDLQQAGGERELRR